MVWYSHLFQNFPQCVVIHTVRGFGIVSKAEIDVFLELLLFQLVRAALYCFPCCECVYVFPVFLIFHRRGFSFYLRDILSNFLYFAGDINLFLFA